MYDIAHVDRKQNENEKHYESVYLFITFTERFFVQLELQIFHFTETKKEAQEARKTFPFLNAKENLFRTVFRLLVAQQRHFWTAAVFPVLFQEHRFENSYLSSDFHTQRAILQVETPPNEPRKKKRK